MARLSLVVRMIFCLVLHVGVTLAVDYGDDSDYEDYLDYHVLLPERRPVSSVHGMAHDKPQDDLYIASEETEDRSRRVAETRGMDPEAMDTEEKWPSVTERVYRYTKHRIPGYDYEELDFLRARKGRRCDERSVWTHCLCQFTCIEPNIVDCYTPCSSGCECREDYVYDERTRQCVHPEQCQPNDDYMLY